MIFTPDANDPLTLAMAPPPGETLQQRTEREKQEREAQIVSDNIDEGIKKDRLALKKQKNIVRVLLLGQSESGKLSISFTQQLIFTQSYHTIQGSRPLSKVRRFALPLPSRTHPDHLTQISA